MNMTSDFIHEEAGYRVVPLMPDRWDDFVSVLGTRGIGGCWCMYWISPSSAAWSEGAKGGSKGTNKAAFRQLAEDGPPPGLLAYDDANTPAAWCRVMPRNRMTGLANSRYFKTSLDTEGVWSLSCFVVRPAHRGHGLVSILTRAAQTYARGQGARHLEVYPLDTTKPKSPSTVYTGVATTFERLGFAVVQRTAPHKPMMRLAL